jgi:hypothetical protein
VSESLPPERGDQSRPAHSAQRQERRFAQLPDVFRAHARQIMLHPMPADVLDALLDNVIFAAEYNMASTAARDEWLALKRNKALEKR